MAKQRQYGAKILEQKKLTEYCFYCGNKMGERKKTIDHILPIKYGGSNCFSNLAICCAKCNGIKGGCTITQLIEQLHIRHRFADELEKVKVDKQIKQWERVKIKLKTIEGKII